MWTLEEREDFSGRLWSALLDQTTDDDEMEIIRAIECNYRHLDYMWERKRVLDQQNIWIEEERQKRRELSDRRIMDKAKERMHCKIVICIMVITVIALLWVCTGCQTMAGACRDIESAARYGHEHTVVDE